MFEMISSKSLFRRCTLEISWMDTFMLTRPRGIQYLVWRGLLFMRWRYANLKHYGGSNHLLVPTGLLQERKEKNVTTRRAFLEKICGKYIPFYLEDNAFWILGFKSHIIHIPFLNEFRIIQNLMLYLTSSIFKPPILLLSAKLNTIFFPPPSFCSFPQLFVFPSLKW